MNNMPLSSSLSPYSQLKNEAEQAQSKLHNLSINNSLSFIDAIKKNDLTRIQSLLDWGIGEYFYSIGHMYDSNRTPASSPLYSFYRIHFSEINLDMLNTLIYKSHPYISKITTDQLSSEFSTQFKYREFNSQTPLHFLDKLQWCLEKKNFLFNNYQKDLFSIWGKIYFDREKHQILNQYILQNHPHISQVFSTSSCSDINPEFFYQIPAYKKSFDLYAFNTFKDFTLDCMNKAVSYGNKDAINFWLSHYVHMPVEKKVYSAFIAENHKKTSFFETFDLILQNIPIDFDNHILLKSAISNHHEDTILYLIDKYPSKIFSSLEPIFGNEKKNQGYHLTKMKEIYQFYKAKSFAYELDLSLDKSTSFNERKLKI